MKVNLKKLIINICILKSEGEVCIEEIMKIGHLRTLLVLFKSLLISYS